VLPPPPPPPSAQHLSGQLDQTLAELRRRHGIPGISATILFADGSEWNGAAGLADVPNRRPVRDDTAFSIASMSKTFTAAVVLDLVDEGRLSLDEPAFRHTPGVTLNRAITVRMLLDHTSGLSDYFLGPGIDRALTRDRSARWDARKALGFLGRPHFPPGRGWHYSNTNYLLLGLVVEQVTGRSMAREVRERFLDPLKLASMHYQGVEKARTSLARGYRFASGARNARPIDVGDRSGIAPYRALVTAAGAAGSLAGTSRDIARWGRALYAGDALSPAARTLMLDGVVATNLLRPEIPYGLGVQAIPLNGFTTLGHSGRFAGFRGVLRYLPTEDVSIAVLTNQSRTDMNAIVPELLRVLYPDPGACNPCSTRS
jgi:D-alanyl-D-alanine carboxypeptidase